MMNEVGPLATRKRRVATGWYRRAGVSVALASFLALVPIAALHAQATERASFNAAPTTTKDPGRAPELTRNAGVVPILFTSKPIQQHRAGLDLAIVAILVGAFAVFHRRGQLRSVDRFRCSATFAQRRGPPYFHVAI